MTKAAQGMWLAAAGIVVAVATWLLRDNALENHESDERVNQLAGALGGRDVDAQAFDNAPYLLGFGLAAVLFLAGVILYATADRGTTTD